MRSLFDTFVKGFAEQLAGYGFERDKRTRVFRRFSRDGDVFIVELQSSSGSTRTAKAFYIGELLRARLLDSGSDRTTDAEQTVQGRVAEEHIVPLLKQLSGYICYTYDDLDEVALTGALDDTNDESADAWFRYPLMGIPPLTLHLARSPGTALVSVRVRVEGTMKQILATRIATLLNPL